MAQTGYTPILIYSSSTGGNAPTAGNLTNSTLGSELAINITDGKLFYKDNANAIQVIGWKTTPTTAGGTGLTSYTAGDLLYFASGTTLSKLAIGASTTILTSSGTAPQWSAASGITVGTATNIAGGAAGSVPYQTGAGATSLLAIGTAYYQLGVNAGGTAPAWQPSATSVLTTQGDLLYASAANTLARLAKNTTASRYLSNSGTSNNPAWAQIDLTNGVTGTLPTTNGGTGLTSFTANGVLYASSTSALATNANLTYNGTSLAATVSGANSVALDIITGAATPNLYAWRINGSTTRSNGGYIANTSGQLFVGVEGQYGGGSSDYFSGGDSGYDAVLAFASGKGLSIGPYNGAVSFRVGATDVTLKTGNIIQGTAAKGFDFSANTPAAGKTSTLLNWYEEGTWTPALKFGGNSTGMTYVVQDGAYTRVGNQVTVWVRIVLSAYGSSTGVATIEGLPFTVKNLGTNYGSGGMLTSWSGMTGAAAGTIFSIQVALGGTTAALLQGNAAVGLSNMSQGNFTNSSEIDFSFTYFA